MSRRFAAATLPEHHVPCIAQVGDDPTVPLAASIISPDMARSFFDSKRKRRPSSVISTQLFERSSTATK